MSHRKLPPNSEVVRLVQEERVALSEIARRYGCTRQAVTHALRQENVRAPGEVQHYTEYIPWRVRVPHNNDRIVRKLRRYARWKMGDTLTHGQLATLHKWVLFLNKNKLVVDYHPEVGFYYVPRSNHDEPGSLVRKP